MLPNLELMPGTLTKMDPPTWRYARTFDGSPLDPPLSHYQTNSVGYWIRVGNIVWFSVSFVCEVRTLRSRTTTVLGEYFWEPTVDGAPSIDPNLYSTIERRSMPCGVATTLGSPAPGRPKRSKTGVCEIGFSLTGSGGRIYWLFDGSPTRGRGTLAISREDAFHMSGMYVTADQ